MFNRNGAGDDAPINPNFGGQSSRSGDDTGNSAHSQWCYLSADTLLSILADLQRGTSSSSHMTGEGASDTRSRWMMDHASQFLVPQHGVLNGARFNFHSSAWLCASCRRPLEHHPWKDKESQGQQSSVGRRSVTPDRLSGRKRTGRPGDPDNVHEEAIQDAQLAGAVAGAAFDGRQDTDIKSPANKRRRLERDEESTKSPGLSATKLAGTVNAQWKQRLCATLNGQGLGWEAAEMLAVIGGRSSTLMEYLQLSMSSVAAASTTMGAAPSCQCFHGTVVDSVLDDLLSYSLLGGCPESVSCVLRCFESMCLQRQEQQKPQSGTAGFSLARALVKRASANGEGHYDKYALWSGSTDMVKFWFQAGDHLSPGGMDGRSWLNSLGRGDQGGESEPALSAVSTTTRVNGTPLLFYAARSGSIAALDYAISTTTADVQASLEDGSLTDDHGAPLLLHSALSGCPLMMYHTRKNLLSSSRQQQHQYDHHPQPDRGPRPFQRGVQGTEDLFGYAVMLGGSPTARHRETHTIVVAPKDARGTTLTMYACMSNSVEAVEYASLNGGGCTIMGAQGRRSASSSNRDKSLSSSPATKSGVMRAGDAIDDEGMTCAMHAARCAAKEVVAYLQHRDLAMHGAEELHMYRSPLGLTCQEMLQLAEVETLLNVLKAGGKQAPTTTARHVVFTDEENPGKAPVPDRHVLEAAAGGFPFGLRPYYFDTDLMEPLSRFLSGVKTVGGGAVGENDPSRNSSSGDIEIPSTPLAARPPVSSTSFWTTLGGGTRNEGVDEEEDAYPSSPTTANVKDVTTSETASSRQKRLRDAFAW